MGINQANPDNVGREFIRQYYTKWSFNLGDVYQFYGNESTFMYDEYLATGQENIQKIIKGLNYDNSKARIHSVTGVFGQDDSLILQVCGELSIENGVPRKFVQNFVLCKQMSKTYYVQASIFQWLDKMFCAENAKQQQQSNAAVAADNVSAPSSTESIQREVAAPVVNSHVGIDQDDGITDADICFENSFDIVCSATQRRRDEQLTTTATNPSQPNVLATTQCEVVDVPKIVKKVRSEINRLVFKHRIHKLRTITDIEFSSHNKYGFFFDIVCQVVGVLHPVTRNDVYLRVFDGTQLNSTTCSKSLMTLTEEQCHIPVSKIDFALSGALKDYTVDIICFDEFQTEAECCNPGDIVYIRNVRAHELHSRASLKLNGNGAAFKRGIQILEKATNFSWLSPNPIGASTPFMSVVDEEEEEVEKIRYPIAESIMGSPKSKRARPEDDNNVSFVAESPQR